MKTYTSLNYCLVSALSLHLALLGMEKNDVLTDRQAVSSDQFIYKMQDLILYAAEDGSVDILKEMRNRGISPDLKDSRGRTALYRVSCPREGIGNAAQIADRLLKAGWLCDAQDNDGNTALHFAASYGLCDVIDVLIQHNADLDIQRKDGATPLMLADTVEALELLLQAGADPDVKDKAGYTMLHYAVDDS